MGGGQSGERLGRPGLLAGHVALPYRSFFDRPQRLAGDAIKHKKETRFGCHRHDVDHLPVMTHRQELRFGAQVEIPEIVVNDLVMPKPFPCARIQCKNAVAIQIGPFPSAAVEVVGRRTDRKVGNASLLIDGEVRPGVWFLQ